MAKEDSSPALRAVLKKGPKTNLVSLKIINENPQVQSPLSCVPEDIIYKTFYNLDVETTSSLRVVCKKWNRLLE
ncbi:F-box protein, partial [Acinetobacter baumannii]